MIKFRKAYFKDQDILLVDWLSEKTECSKMLIKKAMNNGSVWLKPSGKKKIDRVRFAKHILKKGDYVEFFYDPDLKIDETLQPIELFKCRGYGIWYKPANMLSQGNKFGDAGSLLRIVEKQKGHAYLIHRLDRTTSGLIAVAYDSKAASRLSKMWRERKVEKHYRALVLGKTLSNGVIDEPIEGEEAYTTYQLVKYIDENSLIDVQIETGRTHQIRRHMNFIHHPVIGDNLYGRGNKNKDGLQLVAYKLVVDGQEYVLPQDFSNLDLT